MQKIRRYWVRALTGFAITVLGIVMLPDGARSWLGVDAYAGWLLLFALFSLVILGGRFVWWVRRRVRREDEVIIASAIAMGWWNEQDH